LTVTSHPGETTFRFVLPAELRIGQLGIDFVARTVSHGGEPVHLTPKELDLLR
jgi:DNA-binding response OmpR family regulator